MDMLTKVSQVKDAHWTNDRLLGSWLTPSADDSSLVENNRPISRVERLPTRHAGIILFPVEVLLLSQRACAYALMQQTLRVHFLTLRGTPCNRTYFVR